MYIDFYGVLDVKKEREIFQSEYKDSIAQLFIAYTSKNNKTEESIIFKKPDIIKKESINKKSKIKNNKNMSLQEFSKTFESDKTIIKKFTSNRVENKKKTDNTPIFIKRQFNPKKPPFNFLRKNKTIETPQLNNIQEFPNLK
jgi:hypothetical protein